MFRLLPRCWPFSLSSSQLLCLWILAFCCCLKFLLLKKVYRSTSAIICWIDFFFFKNPAKKRRHSSARIRGYMSANWLEYGRHLARLRRRRRRRRRRAYAPTSNTASHDSHKENPSWVSFSFPWCLWGSAGRPFGPPELRYKQVVTLKRTYVLVISFWVVRTVFAVMLLWKSSIAYLCSFVSTSLCLLTSVISDTKIFLYLRHHQNQGQDHVHKPNQANQLNIERYKKAVSIAIWLQLTLVTCYLPNGIVMALVANSGLSSSIYHAWSYALTLVFLNSSLNSILYCWKIEEVRQAVKNTIRQVLCYRFPS